MRATRLRFVSVGLGLVAAALAAGPAGAETFPLVVSGNRAVAQVAVAGFEIDVEVAFESVVGLNPGALELSAEVVGPLHLIGRVPGFVTLPAALPVALSIEPTPTSALSFSGVVRVSLHTHDLAFTGVGSPLALYSGPLGGELRDITDSVGMGSYRAGGSSGGFSEFVIVADVRNIDTVIAEKFQRAQAVIDAEGPSLSPEIGAALQQHLDEAWSLHLSGMNREAADAAAALGAYVESQSGIAIPDVWRANDPIVNVAGSLRAAAATLRFSLAKKASAGL